MIRPKLKFPTAETNTAPSAVVPRDEVANEAINSVPKDYGLKPNGLTIEDMRANLSLFDSHLTDLDRAAIAVRESESNAKQLIDKLNAK